MWYHDATISTDSILVAQRLTIVLLVSILSACATTPHQPVVSEPESAAGTTPDVVVADTSAATLALLEDSRTAESLGDHQAAINYLERAIRIDPRDPELWVKLAGQHVRSGNPDIAIQQAHKAIALSGTRVDWQRAAWLVIADAEEALGRLEAAAAIRRKWRTIRG